VELTFDMPVLIEHLITLLYAELYNSCFLSREGTRNTREMLVRVRVTAKLQKPEEKKKFLFSYSHELFILSVNFFLKGI